MQQEETKTSIQDGQQEISDEEKVLDYLK